MTKKPSLLTFGKRLLNDTSGVSLTEFAFVLPILLTLGLFGAEVARLSTTKMKVSQIALSLSDNASRLGQTDNSGVTPTISESDVNAVLAGAIAQGESIDMGVQSRIIISSLEYDDFSDRQFISWQRCQGDLDRDSDYGNDTDKNGINGPALTGMGRANSQITAESGSAVMFVEIFYSYENMFEAPFGSGAREFKEEAAFLIRDDRNLSPGLTGGTTLSDCD